MLIPKDKKIRDERYLGQVRGEPCLICGTGGEAHHVMFAEHRGMAQKVGDNWVVPLCHHCHMELHAFGDERSWWDIHGIEPLGWAEKHWSKYKGEHGID